MSNNPVQPPAPEVELPRRQRRALAWISGIIGLAFALYLVFIQIEIIGGPILGLALWAIAYAIGDFLLSWRLGIHQRDEQFGLRHSKEPVRQVLLAMIALPVFFILLVAIIWGLDAVGLDVRAEWFSFLLVFVVIAGLSVISGQLGISIVALFFALPLWGLIGYLISKFFGETILRFIEALFS